MRRGTSRTRLACLAAALLALPATALAGRHGKKGEEPPPRRLSISLSGGIRPDMAGLGSTILQDGSIDVADSSLAQLAYGTGKALMSDRDNMTLAHNSKVDGGAYNMLADYQEGGSMLGGEFGADLRYELDDLIDFPLYVEAGFYSTRKVAGGEQSRTLGDVATANGQLAALLAIEGEDPNDYVGGTMKTTWDASWVEVPVSLGVKVPIKRRYTFAYGYFGASWFKGGFSVGMDVDEAYSNVLATHIEEDPDAVAGYSVTNLSPGAVQDTARFETSAVGLNYGLGTQVHAGRGIAIFVEMNASGAAKTVKTQGLKDETKQLLTAASSQGLAEGNPTWFDNLAYPVVFGGATARVGVRYYAF